MSSFWLKKFVLAAALAVLPLQGIAATLSVLLCHGEAQAHSVHADNGHGHGMQHHDSHHDEGGTTGSSTYHLCCHLAVSSPPVVTLPAALPDFPIRAFVPDPLHDLFVPEQPDRPPLA